MPFESATRNTPCADSPYKYAIAGSIGLAVAMGVGRFAFTPILPGVVYSGVGAGIFAVGLLCLALLHAGLSSSAMWLTLGVLSLALSVAVSPVFLSGVDVVISEVPEAAGQVLKIGYILPFIFSTRPLVGHPAAL